MGACVRDTCGRPFAIFSQVDLSLGFSYLFIYFHIFFFFLVNTVLVSRVGLLVYCVVCV